MEKDKKIIIAIGAIMILVVFLFVVVYVAIDDIIKKNSVLDDIDYCNNKTLYINTCVDTLDFSICAEKVILQDVLCEVENEIKRLD